VTYVTASFDRLKIDHRLIAGLPGDAIWVIASAYAWP